MELKKMFKYLPVAILIIAMIYSIYVAASTNVMLTKKHYIGFSLLLVSVMFYFFNTRIAQVIMLTILILGTFDLVAFTPSITSTTFFIYTVKPPFYDTQEGCHKTEISGVSLN